MWEAGISNFPKKRDDASEAAAPDDEDDEGGAELGARDVMLYALWAKEVERRRARDATRREGEG